MRYLNALLLGAIALFPCHADAQAPPRPMTGAAVLQPGDAVVLTVWRRPELSGEFPIAADSSISHPLLRQVKVAGLPIELAEGRVREYLETLESDPQFVMEPRLRVAIGGEVLQPSLYSFTPAVTVAQAVSLAGGPTERGRLDHVMLRRGGEDTLIDLTDPESVLAQAPIRSGDQLMVGRRRSWFRDYLVPAASVTAAIGTVVNLITRF